MPCFPPLCAPVRRHLRGLFHRKGGGSQGAAPGSTSSSKTALPTVEPKEVALQADSVAESSSPPSLVCAFCRETGLFAPGHFREALDAQLSYAGFSYSTAWSQVQASAAEGCNWCRLLSSTRTEGMYKETLRVTVGFRVHASNNTTPKGVQTLKLVLDDTPHSVYYVSTDPDDVAASLIVAKTCVRKLSSHSTYVMATNCIMDCIRNHERCPPPHSATLPARVIDCLDPAKPRLHVSNKDEQAAYLALSYTRGTTSSFGTTTDTLDAYLLGIDMESLPQTIRDAIRSTHALGVRYLWVDALCILQDSETDKIHEIAQMGSIFRNAYFTIIASSARSADEGFLQDRVPPSPPDITLPFRCSDGQVGAMSLSPIWRQYDGSSEPVCQRAWCLEERLLSPRALIYASHTLQYHCQTTTVNVGNAVCGPITGHRLPNLLFRSDFDDRNTSPALSPNDTKALRYSWIEAVGEYTQRSLGDPADKLVAFAAVAEVFQRAWKSEYLAGLWRHSLVQDLLWYKTSESRHPRPERYRAPTWSWASVDGHVWPSLLDDRLDLESVDTQTCDILSCEVTPVTADLPLGQVSSGVLTLRARMFKASWNPAASMPDLYLYDKLDQPTDTLPLHIGCAYPDSDVDAKEIWALPLMWNTKTQHAAGLIVTRLTDSTATENAPFRRVGYFHSPEDGSGGLWWMSASDEERRDFVIE
ncbi:HET-domain-containing protein [Lentinus tigrinus ALCF2SS1-7]|uniref:HET-domain-containing protein n=1 Tax=Lentinus tigrinus ALCF2SS1-6 TaxID=1328759 RepID=A0A5C2SFS9_9APHY|nr:HET-domain-containing protein [Lentinus tigrinus ALCF2SS1-6]RPD74616.1 HET-domain-containing protein [Lentinus tigrinus ALCF2SS1-7]